MNAAADGFAGGAERISQMNPVRVIVMIVAAAVAFWKGWEIHRGETAVLAYGLGAMALLLGVWHLTRERRRAARRRV
ncbi:MAG: hypothetical protein ACRD3S_22295 [Terracidiphilus sp.]